MSYKTKHAIFIQPNALGTQRISGIGFKPKALIFYTNHQPGTSSGKDAVMGLGFATDSENASASVHARSGVTTTNTLRRHDSTKCINLMNNSGTVVMAASLTSMEEDGFVLNWSTIDTTQRAISVLALGGDDLEDAQIATFSAPAGTGNVNYSGLNFQPDCMLVFGEALTALPQAATNLALSFGFGVDANSQAAMGTQSAPGVTTSQTDRAQKTNRIIVLTVGDTIFYEAALVSMNTTGFTLNWVTTSSGRLFSGLFLKGGKYKVGSFLQPNGIPGLGKQAISDVGFQPKGLLLGSINQVQTSLVSTESRLTIGATSGPKERSSIWFGDRDGVTTTISDSHLDTEKVIKMLQEGSTPSVLGSADIVSFDGLGFTLNWVTVTTVNRREIVYLAFGSETEEHQEVQKHYFYKVYDQGELVETWTQEVISEPSFIMNINGGAGELVIKLSRPFDDFGEDEDVKLNNKVDCYVVDKDAPNGRLLYSGYISGYIPIIDKASEHVEITCFSFVAELQRMILRNASGDTTLTYSSMDPAAILRDVIDKYRSVLEGTIRYTASSIQNTNTSVSYTFKANTVKEVVDKIIELCPVGWYWRVDPDNIIYLKPKNVLSDHKFTLGLEVERLRTFRRIEDLVNRILFTGAGNPPMFRKYENTGSQDTYGLYEVRKIDQRVTDAATAAIISNRIIDNQKDPEIRSQYEIIDNNGPSDRGFDVESVKVGQTLKISNLKTGVRSTTLWDIGLWDVDVWDQTLATSAADVIQILSISYKPDSIVLEASSRLPQIAKRIEDINRNLENSQTAEVPTAPS